jgi:hypothetical protein
MILSPLEQFEIISILPIQIFCFDFSITNSLLISMLTLAFFSNIIYFFSSNENYLKKIPLQHWLKFFSFTIILPGKTKFKPNSKKRGVSVTSPGNTKTHDVSSTADSDTENKIGIDFTRQIPTLSSYLDRLS